MRNHFTENLFTSKYYLHYYICPPHLLNKSLNSVKYPVEKYLQRAQFLEIVTLKENFTTDSIQVSFRANIFKNVVKVFQYQRALFRELSNLAREFLLEKSLCISVRYKFNCLQAVSEQIFFVIFGHRAEIYWKALMISLWAVLHKHSNAVNALNSSVSVYVLLASKTDI